VARRIRAGSGLALDDGDAPGEDSRGGVALDTGSDADLAPLTGPHDADDLDPEITDAIGLVDFGSIRVPVPADGTVTVEPTANGRMQAVHITLPAGRLSVSALAAPKTSKLWPELAREIDASLREGGARVRSFQGDWGRELHATTGGATSVFIGVDGARWMLYGVATGPTTQAAELEGELRRMLRGTVVVRGKSPYPVRTILPIAVPEHLAHEVAAAATAAPKKKTKTKKAGTGPKKSAQKTAQKSAQKTGPKTAQKQAARTAAPDAAVTDAAGTDAEARKAALRKAAAKAAVRKAAAKTAAEKAAAQRAAEAEQETSHPAAGEAARVVQTGPHQAPASTISTGPGPGAPLREQAPSARRAAAVPPATKDPSGAPGWDDAGRAAPPREVADVHDVVTEALRIVEPGSGGRRRLREPAGETHDPGFRAPAAPETGGRRRLRDGAGGPPGDGPRPRETASWAPAEAEPVRPVREPEPGGRRALREPDGVGSPDVSATGRRYLREPDEAAAGPLWPDDRGFVEGSGVEGGVPATGRRALREPDAGPAGGSRTGRRYLGEPDGAASPGPAGPPRPFAGEPHGAGPGAINGTGRRRLQEPGPPAEFGAGGRRSLREPDGVGSPDVSATGRRYLREPDEAGSARPVGSGGRRFVEGSGVEGGVPATGRRALREPDPGPAGLSATGRRSLREPDDAGSPDVTGTGRRHLREPGEVAPGPVGSDGRRFAEGPGAEGGVPAAGRRALREPDAGSAGVSATGRRYLREPDEAGSAVPVAPGRAFTAEPPGSGVINGTGRRRPQEPGPAGEYVAGGRRSLREPDPMAPGEAAGWDGRPGVGEREPLRTDGVSATGRRYALDPDVPPTGRRRLQEPDPVAEFGGPGLRPPREPDAGIAEISGTGRRRLRDPDPVAGFGTAERRDLDRRDLGGPVGLGPVEPSGTGRRWSEEPEPVDRSMGQALGQEPDITGFGEPPRTDRRRPEDLGPVDGPGTRRRHLPDVEPGTPAEPPPPGGRRRVREPDGPGSAGTGAYAVESFGPVDPADRAGGRRRLSDPGEEFAPGGRRHLPAPEWQRSADLPPSRGRHEEPGSGLPSMEPSPSGAPDPGSTERRRGGRHTPARPGVDPAATMPLRALIGELDPSRPRGRHRRQG
jgi:hypothetical protein